MPVWLIQIVIAIVFTVASTLIKQATTPAAKTNDAGLSNSYDTGGTVPMSFVVGTLGLAGKLEYENTWGTSGGTPNAYLTQVISLSDLPIAALTGLFADAETQTISGSGHVDQGFPVAGSRAGNLWVEFYDGTQSTASAFLLSKFGSDPDRPWLSDMVGQGVAYVTLTALYDRTVWSGFPTFLPVVQGILLYDPRQDSTAGGSGSQLRSDPTTWAFSDNPVVIIYNILIGIQYAGTWLWGMQDNVDPARLPYAIWAAAMDACDESVSLDAGGSETRFRVGREISVAEKPADVITELLVACNGRISEAAGIYSIIVGAPGDAVGSLTDEDVIITEGSTLEPFPTLDTIVNGATGTYLEPSQAWASKEAVPYYRSDLETEDDGRRQAEDLTLTAVFSGTQAQRILKATVEDARRFYQHVMVLRPPFGAYTPLDVLAFTSAKNDYSAKDFLVISTEEGPNGNVVVGLQEIDSSDHDWTPATDEKPYSFAPLTPVRPPTQTLTGFTAVAADFVDNTGTSRRPGIAITYDSGQTDVRNVHVQVREKNSAAIEFETELTYQPPYGGTLPHAFLAATIYQARADYIPYGGRLHEFCDWIDVTTNDVLLTSTDIGGDLKAMFDTVFGWGDVPGDITAEAADRAAADASEATDRIAGDSAEATARASALVDEETARLVDASAISQAMRDLQETVMRTALGLSDSYFTTQLVQNSLLQSIQVSYDNSVAGYTSAINVAVGPGSAVAQSLTTLQAEVDFNNTSLLASISAVQSAYTAADTAEAAARNALQLQVTGGYTGSDPSLLTTGLIYLEQQSRISGDTALSTAISLVAAGSAILFDWIDQWTFDTDIQGWTGNGTPTESGGFLRPANDASNPYVTSPTGLAVVAATYSQVKVYIQKVGTPTWEGLAWYKRVGDSTWDVSRQASVSEPTYDGTGRAIVTWNMTWDSTIDQIRIDLTSNADVSNYSQFDWITIGRPSPGASQAQIGDVQTALTSSLLAETSDREALSTLVTGAADPTGLTLSSIASGLIYDEKTARTTEDSSLNTLITGVQSNLDDTNDDVSALSAAQSTLSSSVSSLSGTVSSNSSAITGLTTSVAGKADTTVTDDLQAEIDDIGGSDSVSQMAQTVRALQLSVDRLAVQTADGMLTGQRLQQYVSGTLVQVSQQLVGQINSTNGTVSLLGQQIATVNLTLPDLASLAITNALDGRVTETETSLTSQGSSITSINTSLAGKADNTALTTLTGRVTTAEGNISTLNGSLTSLTTTVGTKASTSALNSLSTTVTSQGTELTAVAGGVESVMAALGGDSSQINVQFEADAAPSGFAARYKLSAAVDSDGISRVATFFIDVPSSHTDKTRIGLSADQTVFFDSSGNPIVLIDGSGIMAAASGEFSLDFNTGDFSFGA